MKFFDNLKISKNYSLYNKLLLYLTVIVLIKTFYYIYKDVLIKTFIYIYICFGSINGDILRIDYLRLIIYKKYDLQFLIIIGCKFVRATEVELMHAES